MIVRAAAFVLAALVAQTITITPPKRITGEPDKAGPGMISKTMATSDAQSFARAVAEAGHAAGFITPMGERQVLLPPDTGEMLTLDEATAAFTARGTYRASRRNGVTVFRHARTPEDIALALDTPRQMYAIKGTFSSALFGTVLRTLALRRVGGLPGKEPGAGPECPVESIVTIPAARATIVDTLNGMVARTKGVAWLVRFGSNTDNMRMQLGYVCGNGVWSALSVPGW